MVDLLALRQDQREPREVVGHHVVAVPPRLVVGERLRMVALARAADRDVREVLVERVDAQHVEPVADPLHVLEPQVPAAGPVGLAQRPLAAQLIGHAGQFLDRPHVAELGVRRPSSYWFIRLSIAGRWCQAYMAMLSRPCAAPGQPCSQ